MPCWHLVYSACILFSKVSAPEPVPAAKVIEACNGNSKHYHLSLMLVKLHAISKPVLLQPLVYTIPKQ